MNKLRDYLNSLTPAEQKAFARRCGTTLAYLRKAISVKSCRLGEAICMAIEAETAGEIRVESLRPDLTHRWQFLRGRAVSDYIESVNNYRGPKEKTRSV